MTVATKVIHSKSPAKTILLAALIAGTLDALAATISYKINVPDGNPLKVWRYVASGVFGSNGLESDLGVMAMWGLFFHFITAFLFTLFFFFIYPSVRFLQKNLFVSGMLYGLFVWIVMNLGVVPLSNVPAAGKLWAFVSEEGKLHAVLQLPSNYKRLIIGILVILFCVGLPIALIIGKYYSKKVKVVA